MNHSYSANAPAGAPQIEGIQIIELLGEGGMSRVFKARQVLLKRLVAVKVLSRTMITEEMVKRFKLEAKITNELEHPNIVKTIAFGITTEGQPYLVMEYLNGRSLADELKNQRLNLRQFKDVFCPALSALEHAHKNGMIHRDIKPSNLMICQNDQGAEVLKLVDFGIAKYFAADEAELAGLTASNTLLGTPNYMSPEQCDGKPLDARSDLYSLSCVMYEALSGEPPFSAESPLLVMQKHLSEPAPSVSKFLNKVEIEPELAQIVLSGLAKDPALRPDSALSFRDNLLHNLERCDLNLTPRLIDAAELQKRARFARNKKILLSIIALFFLMVFCFHFYQRLEQISKAQTQSANMEPSRSQRNHRQRSYEEQEAIRLKHIKDAEKSDIASRDKLLIPSLDDAATFYEMHKNWDKAESILLRLIPLKKIFPSKTEKLSKSLVALAICAQNCGQEQIEEQALLEDITIMDKVPEYYAQNLDDALSRLSHIYIHQHKEGLAEPIYLRLIELRKEQDPSRVNESLFGLATCYKNDSKWDLAASVYEQLVSRAEKEPGANYERLLYALNLLNGSWQVLHQWDKSELVTQRILAIRQKHHGLMSQYVKSIDALGSHYLFSGQVQTGERIYQELKVNCEFSPQQNKNNMAFAFEGLAKARFIQGNYAIAEQLYRQDLHLREQAPKDDDKPIAKALDYAAEPCKFQHKWAEAAALYRREVSVLESVYGEKDEQIAIVLMKLAKCCAIQHRYAEAEESYQRVVAIREHEFGSDAQELLWPLQELAACYLMQKDAPAASALIKRSKSIQANRAKSDLQSKTP